MVENYKDIRVYGMTIKDELNQNIFNGTFIKSNVKNALVRIADEFHDYIDLDVEYEDVVIVGSSINYHWSASSDVDLHLVYDFSKFPCPEDFDFIREFLISKKKTFNDRHDIKLFKHEVEVYCEDINDNTKSSAIYSIINNVWVRKPTIHTINTEKDKVRRLAFKFAKKIDGLEKFENDPKELFSNAIKIKDALMTLRTRGLSEGGEYNFKNITYKTLRNMGYIEYLFEYITQGYDEKLSYPQNKTKNKIKNKYYAN